MLTIPFNILDEAFTHNDDPTQPPSVHIEVRIDGRFDDARMRDAFMAGLDRHVLARARLEPWTDETTTYEWIVDDIPQIDPLLIVSTDDPAQVDRIRNELLSVPVSIFESPPVRARLVHNADGDYLLLSIHHAACDGMGALRLLASILRAYLDIDDPLPDLDPVEVHQLPEPELQTDSARQWYATRMEFERYNRMGSFPARLPQLDDEPRAGYGIHQLSVPLEGIVKARLRKSLNASVNDVLIAAASLACARMIEHGGEPPGRVTVMMPINARPAGWREEIVGNFVTADVVSTSPEDRVSTETCLESVAGWTELVKKVGPGPALAALSAIPPGPVSGRRAFAQWASQTGAQLADTTVLSNLGRVSDAWLDSDTIRIIEFGFSPPPTLPTGLGIGAIANNERLFLNLRHSWRLWSTGNCAFFGELLIQTLEEICQA